MSLLVVLLQFEATHTMMAYAQPSEGTSPRTGGDNVTQSPTLSSSTTNGTYIVQLDWEPEFFGIDNDTTFMVSIFDKSGSPLPSSVGINYDFTVSDSYLSPIIEFYNETLYDSGKGRPLEVRFESPGPVEITVWLNPVDPNDEQGGESATFSMTVAPEFPTAVPILFATGATMIAIVIILARLQGSKKLV